MNSSPTSVSNFLPSRLAVEPDESFASGRAVADAVGAVAVPGHAPQPEVRVADRHGLAPVSARPWRTRPATGAWPRRSASRSRAAAPPSISWPSGVTRDLGVAQVGVRERQRARRGPVSPSVELDHPERAVRRDVPLPFAEDAEPAVLESDQVGEGVVRRLVPDLADLDELRPAGLAMALETRATKTSIGERAAIGDLEPSRMHPDVCAGPGSDDVTVSLAEGLNHAEAASKSSGR